MNKETFMHYFYLQLMYPDFAQEHMSPELKEKWNSEFILNSEFEDIYFRIYERQS